MLWQYMKPALIQKKSYDNVFFLFSLGLLTFQGGCDFKQAKVLPEKKKLFATPYEQENYFY